ncbi:MAG: polysaccharide biosynthesis protein [Clostridia bacterium]|nr:polysaccharide biosynthesis protein [Clostridia bacterium]
METKKTSAGWRIFKKLRRPILFLVDVCGFLMVNTAFYLAANAIYQPFATREAVVFATVATAIALFGVRLSGNMYHSMWRYSDTRIYLRLIICDAIAGVLALILVLIRGLREAVLQVVAVTAVTCLVTLCARFVYRLLYKWIKRQRRSSQKVCTNIAVVGAGQLGIALVRSLRDSAKTNYRPVCFIDIDSMKIGKSITDLPVYGAHDINLPARLQKNEVREIVVAINDLDQARAEFLFQHYADLGYVVKVYDAPALGENHPEPELVIRDFQIEDLLFRKPISYHQSLNYYAGKTILVTGGGGSIGSELCRRIAACNPGHLVIFDIYENNAYEIQQELIQTYGDKLTLTVEIGSVRDRARLDQLFRTYRPQVVFHAAAHKHVPLMEQSSAEAIKNNIFGTYNTADMAEIYGAERFILISTDKAVNPTNVMGATKRMCEMLIQCRTNSMTRFAAVRFGNVLGSNGSVIPLFQKQIKKGGPVTITDKRIVRYFMTIPEASQLVLQAGTMARRGELFVLDMGEPVKIYELAEKMIRLCGLEPGQDIEIKEIGLRPGEKLFEELLIHSETHVKTTDDEIFIEWDTPLSREEIEARLTMLRRTVEQVENGEEVSVRETLMAVVPTFVDAETFNAKSIEEAEKETAELTAE